MAFPYAEKNLMRTIATPVRKSVVKMRWLCLAIKLGK